MYPIKSLFIALILICAFSIQVTGKELDKQAEDSVFVGEWSRTDGSYVIRVRDVKPDGLLDAEYLNPKSINIAEANVSEWKGLKKLFIKLQDEGYPGSTYTLYYSPEKDALAGFYYQATRKETFEVVFLRNQKQ